jgi:pimeloyl-ACP methyl ester carboxylesterase
MTPIDLRAEDHSFDSNGVKIHYIVEGKGEPVLLIHGFTVSIDLNWGLPGVIKNLAKDYQVIALDNRGHGQSDKPHDPKKYGPEMVEDAVRLLDHLKIKQAHVVGYSMGGMITLKLVTTHPERVRTATLGGAGWSKPGERDRGFLELADSLEQGKGFGPLILRLTPKGQPKPTEEQIKATNERISAANDVKALAAVIRGFKELAVSEDKLKTINVPMLALIGANDPIKAAVDTLKERLPDLQVVVIDDADHMTAVGKGQFTKGLREFLAKHRSGREDKKSSPEPAGTKK